jgi:Fe2+ transport system protein FeoA
MRTLAKCVAGDRVVVGSVVGGESRIVRLASVGILPGAELCVQQTRPVVLVELDQSVLALEQDVAASVWVTTP